MDSYDIDRLKHTINSDTVRRLLIKYFIEKGYSESFDKMVSPTILQDLVDKVPHLATKIEIVPHAVEIDPITYKQAKLGWNLFVLGNHRMFLGETMHYDLLGAVRQIYNKQFSFAENSYSTSKLTTPRKIINFITRTMNKSERGYIDFKSPCVDPTRAFDVNSGPANLSGQVMRAASASSMR